MPSGSALTHLDHPASCTVLPRENVLQLVRGRDSSPALRTSGQSHQPSTRDEGCYRSKNISLRATPSYGRWGLRPDLPCSRSWCQFTCTTVNRVSSAMLPRWGAASAFLSVAAGKAEGQFPSQLEAVEAEGGGDTFLTFAAKPKRKVATSAFCLWVWGGPIFSLRSRCGQPQVYV